MKKKIEALKAKVEKIIANSEYRSVKVHGVTCSRADLEMIVFFADVLLKQGNISGYVIFGETKQVFEKIGVEF